MRTIVEDPSVTAIIDAETANYSRLRDLIDGWLWRFARMPQPIGVQLQGNIYLIRLGIFAINGLPKSIRMIYRFTNQEVEILRIFVIK